MGPWGGEHRIGKRGPGDQDGEAAWPEVEVLEGGLAPWPEGPPDWHEEELPFLSGAGVAGPYSVFRSACRSAWRGSCADRGSQRSQCNKKGAAAPQPMGSGGRERPRIQLRPRFRPGALVVTLHKYPMLHNSASGLEIWLPGWISAGFLSGKPRNRPSGRPKGGRRADLRLSRLESDSNPIEIRPGRQISGPEALLRNIG